jgi:calcineurin-like phosphoesterase family protein
VSTFIVGDTHFGHSAIIRMCGRPFVDVYEMNEAMVAGWNAVVRADDTVIHLGDFAHRYPPAKLPLLFGSLNGRKHLIRGNHDRKETLALAWESVSDVVHTSIDSQRVTLCHYAMRTWPGIRKGALQLYGHSHGRLPGNQQSMDVGVEVMGWSPVRMNQIKAVMAELPPMVQPEGGDDLENDEGGGLKP